MFFYQLPPVGNPVTLDSSKKLTDVSVLSSYQVRFYDSGTAALAAALVAVLVDRSETTKPDGQEEVILPAYACPDLVSAVVFAGAKPVLVDLEADRPWLDLNTLPSAINRNTVAIIGVDLFGIRERWQQLRVIAQRHGVVLIEDSAQYFPGEEETSDWQGDLVVLSFGRGKPVSLLGGGAVLSRNAVLHERLPQPAPAPANWRKQLAFGLKSRIYNAIISPYLYWALQAMPFLHLGETRYHALPDIAAMDDVRLDRLASNMQRYQKNAAAVVRRERISSMLDTIDTVNNLPAICNTGVNSRLLRYPLLVAEPLRDRVLQQLLRAGLGASSMYPSSLPEIEGLEQVLDSKQRYHNAEAFAARLITLPTHRAVSDKDIAQMEAVLRYV